MTQMTNQETDTALILENELTRRVREVTRGIIQDEIRREVKRIFLEQKDSMLMEVSIAVGKTLQVVENEGRKPLWDSTPEEFGLTSKALNSHAMTPIRNAYKNLEQELPDALREQTSSV
jgi:hypothetical protein